MHRAKFNEILRDAEIAHAVSLIVCRHHLTEADTEQALLELHIKTTATATLKLHAKIPDASQAGFMDAALAAKTNCPIARLLKTNISMTAALDL